MAEYVVEVTATYRELYFVDADSLEEAGDIWHSKEPDYAECTDITDVFVEELEDDE